jgi:hypothetical protein
MQVRFVPDLHVFSRACHRASFSQYSLGESLPVSSGIGVLSLDNGPRCLMVSPDRSRGHYRRQELVVDLNADPRRVSLFVTLEK